MKVSEAQSQPSLRPSSIFFWDYRCICDRFLIALAKVAIIKKVVKVPVLANGNVKSWAPWQHGSEKPMLGLLKRYMLQPFETCCFFNAEIKVAMWCFFHASGSLLSHLVS